MQYEVYEKEITSIDTKMKKLERDRRMSFTQDIIDQLIRKILNIQPSKIFNDEIYQEFRRRLLPSSGSSSKEFLFLSMRGRKDSLEVVTSV